MNDVTTQKIPRPITTTMNDKYFLKIKHYNFYSWELLAS